MRVIVDTPSKWFALLVAAGMLILWTANFSVRSRDCNDISDTAGMGNCFMLTGLYQSFHGDYLAAIRNVELARVANPKDPQLAFYECQWQAKINLHKEAVASCRDAISLSKVSGANSNVEVAAFQHLVALLAYLKMPADLAASCHDFETAYPDGAKATSECASHADGAGQ